MTQINMKRMKKRLLIISLAICSLGVILNAQNKGDVSIKPVTLKTNVDTVSYALGADLSQKIDVYIKQMGLLADTSIIISQSMPRIEETTDARKKAELQKELRMKLDSLDAANADAKKGFIRGFVNTFYGDKSDFPYNLGVSIALQTSTMTEHFMKEAQVENEEINKDAFIMGVINTLNNEKHLISNFEDIIDQKLSQAQKLEQEKREKELEVEYADRMADAKKFMEDNKLNPGVVTLPSGLQYKIITAGTGEKPKMGQHVTVNYEGKLTDGTIFDSTIQRGEPATFSVGQLIDGWNEALQLMPEGSKWILYIPYNLAYGAIGNANIKPYSNLIFELELISVGQ